MKCGLAFVACVVLPQTWLGVSYGQLVVDGAPDWAAVAPQQRSGRAGLAILDLGSGPELLVAQGNYNYDPGTWFTLKWDASTKTYQRSFAQVPYVEFHSYQTLNAARSGELDPSPGPEIAISLDSPVRNEKELLIYSAESKRFIRSFPIETDTFECADLDGDRVDEIILSNGKVLDSSGSLLWKASSVGGSHISIGNADQDPGQEIVYAGTTTVFVVDVATRSLQGSFPSSSSGHLMGVDIVPPPGPLAGKIVIGSEWGGVKCVDPTTGDVLWNIPNPTGWMDHLVTNLDSDPEVELVVGDIQWGGLHFFDLTSGTPVQTSFIREPGFDPAIGNNYSNAGTSALAKGDLDGDGNQELVWSYGGHVSGKPCTLWVYDLEREAFEWSSEEISIPVSCRAAGDVTGDGNPELVGITGSRKLVLIDPETGAEINASPVFWEGPTFNATPPSLVDLDHDEVMEIATASGGPLKVFGYDPETGFEQIWSSVDSPARRSLSSPLYDREQGFLKGIDLVDVGHDGHLKAVVTVSNLGYSTPLDSIQIFDVETGRLEWLSGDLFGAIDGVSSDGYSVQSYAISDIDSDDSEEIVVVFTNGGAVVVDLVTHTLEFASSAFGANPWKVAAVRKGVGGFTLFDTYRAVHFEPDGSGQYQMTGYGERVTTWDQPISAALEAPRGMWWMQIDWNLCLVSEKDGILWSSIPMYMPRKEPVLVESSDGTILASVLNGEQIAGFSVSELTDLPMVGIGTANDISEAGGIATVRFSRVGGGIGAATLRFTTSGAAETGVDFHVNHASPVAPGVWEVTLREGDNFTEVEFAAMDDSKPEGPEDIEITLLPSDNYELSADERCRFQILDSEPKLSITTTTLPGREGDPIPARRTVYFNLERTGDTTEPLVVSFETGGTATIRADYARFPKVFSFKPGERYARLEAGIVADKIAEAPESVIVRLLATDKAWVDPSAAEATFWINDGQPTISLGNTVEEPRGTKLMLTNESAFGYAKVRLELRITDPLTGKTRVGKGGAKVTPEGGYCYIKRGKRPISVVARIVGTSAFHLGDNTTAEFEVPAR